MEHVVVLTPAEYLARFAAAGPRTSARRRSGAGSLRLRCAFAATIGVAVTAASYGVSLAWVVWFVRESGSAWAAQLVGRIG